MAREYHILKKGDVSPSGINYRKELNAEQYAAVSASAGRTLVIAGAGSGKTRTLTYRVAWLLDHEVEARNILLLTFTNKAAKEMIHRVRELVTHDASELWAGTFHSVGSRILRKHAEEMGFTRAFSIMDRDDQKSMLSNILKACDFKVGKQKFPKPEVLASIFSLVVNTRETLEEVIEVRYPYLEEFMLQIAEVQSIYKKKKQETNCMDFDDLLVLCVELLTTRPDLLSLYQRKFKHILVDEFQDTNRVQCELIELLEGESNNLMVVGDDAQSIYSWRGADMKNILEFPNKKGNCQTHTIEMNYRSVPEILDLSNEAIRANTERFDKNLQSSREASGLKPAMVPVDDPRMQAAFVVQRIRELEEEGVPLDEIAILYRAHYQSLEVEMELTIQGVPFVITSGIRFFEQTHIKDLIAFMRFACNRRDEISFKRMVELLVGVGPGAAEKLWLGWKKSGWAESDDLPNNFSDVLGKLSVPKKAAGDWQQLTYILDEMLSGNSENPYAKPSDMIFSILEGMYDDYLKATFENYDKRKADVEKLMDFSNNFDDTIVFLEQLSLLTNADDRDEEVAKERVTLSSIHQAKGLEWQVVFLIWLADGQFPNGRILEAENNALLEEERRLFYVAVTRAKDQLYMIYPMINPKSYTGDIIQRPSRFLSDFPADLAEAWDVGTKYVDTEEDEAPF